MKYIESEVLELKTKFSDTICKDIVADNIEPWVKENLADYSNSLFVHFQGNELSLVDMSDLVGKIANSIEIMEDNIVFSISGEEYKDAGIKISFWYR